MKKECKHQWAILGGNGETKATCIECDADIPIVAYKQIRDLLAENARLQQYESAITSAVKGNILVWNLQVTNCTVVEHTCWLSHLATIARLREALERIANPYDQKWYKAANSGSEVMGSMMDIAKAALEEK